MGEISENVIWFSRWDGKSQNIESQWVGEPGKVKLCKIL
jgi:hypothetical protein